MNDVLLSHVAASAQAQHVVLAYLLARDNLRSDQPLSRLHQSLAHELTGRIAETTPAQQALAARSVHELDMLLSLAGQMHALMRPAAPPAD